MEFTTPNLINTTTMIAVGSGSLSAENILTRNPTFQYVSDGFDNDLTTSSITINFDETTTVRRIALDEINWKDFTAFYNGATANTFSLTSTGATTVSDFSSNSETAMYMFASSVDVTSVTFDVLSTQVADSEKAVGYIYLGDLVLDLSQIPTAKNYKPLIDPKEVVHELSDGAIRVNRVSEKRSVKIKLNNIATTLRNSLKDVYDRKVSTGFAAFPTMTGWDKFFFVGIWPGKFNAYEFTDDASGSGHNVSIDLRESDE